jgi:hypothetical protein
MEKTAYEYYLESDNKEQFIIDKSIEWGIPENELFIILNNTNKIIRELQYPKVVDQLDMLWHELTTVGNISKNGEWYQTINTIKNQYPKPTN